VYFGSERFPNTIKLFSKIVRRRRQNQAGKAGATQASQERQDNRVSPDRPELHVHEGQAGDQPPEVVDDDTNDVDIVEDENNDHFVRVDDNNNDDAPDVHVDESQAVDQSLDVVEGDNNNNADVIEVRMIAMTMRGACCLHP
jgi:hypothetical protein